MSIPALILRVFLLLCLLFILYLLAYLHRYLTSFRRLMYLLLFSLFFCLFLVSCLVRGIVMHELFSFLAGYGICAYLLGYVAGVPVAVSRRLVSAVFSSSGD